MHILLLCKCNYRRAFCTLVLSYKECARFACTLLCGSLHACCYNLEMVVEWLNVFKFPSIAHACPVYAFSCRLHNICNWLPNQPRAKTQWCCCSYSRDSLAPIKVSIAVVAKSKANRSDLTSSFRLGRQQV